MSTLGVIVFKTREMQHLSQSLQSIAWADRVKVVPFDEEKNTTFEEMKGRLWKDIGTDWVLHLWGEERVDSKLAQELRRICRSEFKTAPPQYRIPVRTRLLDRWIEGSVWGPAPAPRLVRHGGVLPCGWGNPVSLKGWRSAGLLGGWIEDYSCEGLSDGLDRLNEISSLWAKKMHSEGRTLRLVAGLLRSIKVFGKLFFVKGFLFKGLAGLALSVLASYMDLVSGMKLSEMHRTSV